MATPLQILKKYWGYEAFRSPQDQIIESVLQGNDTLALMPTGGGKSVCYQVPALSQAGICIVVSPLIALMKDQVYQLKKRGIDAVAIYSGMHYKDIDRILDNCVYGNTKLLYLSPERLITDLARERIARMPVNLIAVDEAHCISQWGYDFRPPYLQIAEIRTLHPKVPVLALTATATQEVEKDIQEKLMFRATNSFKVSFARNNLAYVVLHEEAKENKLLEMVQKVKGSGVVYVRNRRKTKELALLLRKHGIAADFYHAGLDNEARSTKQEAWLNNQIRIMVSTNAFGMGIDKPDVRLVVHMDLPDSLEAYFQEAGRAGRDGKKSYAVLLYNATDKYRLEKDYERSFPPISAIRQVYRALGSYFQLAVGSGEGKSFDFNIIDFTKKFSLDVVKSFNALRILEQEGWLVVTEAVFVPSQFQILVSKDQLYDYQLRHSSFDKILKVILRSTQGAFQHYVKIRETQLAKSLSMTTDTVKQTLQKMHNDSIIRYLPQRDQPQLLFLQERVAAEDLTIDRQRYEFRKKRHFDRIKIAIEYAEKLQCRQQQLLAYFGELQSAACGVCDVCLERNKSNVSTDEMENYKRKIKAILDKEPLTLTTLVDSFTPKRRKRVLKVIEHLMEEGIVDKEGESLVWK